MRATKTGNSSRRAGSRTSGEYIFLEDSRYASQRKNTAHERIYPPCGLRCRAASPRCAVSADWASTRSALHAVPLAAAAKARPSADELVIVGEVEKKVLWLASWSIHHANQLRENVDGVKVGGHQAC